MNYTQEQLDVIRACNTTGDKIISVNAIAGSGKTNTCCGIVNSIRPRHGFYTAFNRAIVEDSDKKFGEFIPCRTLHSLAYKYANKSKKGIKTLTYKDIDIKESIKEKVKVIDLIENFFLSKYDNIDDFFMDYPEDLEYRDDVLYYMDKMLNGEINPTFSFLLKKFHLMLLDKEINPYFDLFLFDEVQDMSPVMLEIFKLINADKKVILGDRFQNIYSFMNTVNAFEELDFNDLEEYNLTKCFRCKSDIGELVEDYGNIALESDYRFEGCLNKENEKVKIAYLSKLNSSLIMNMYDQILHNKTFKLIRDVNSIFEFPIAMENCIKNRPIYSHKYKYLEDVRSKAKCIGYELLEYIIKDDKIDEQTKYTAELLKEFIKKRVNLYELKEKVQNMTPNPNVILSTVHAYKGLEADIVVLDYDLKRAVLKTIEDATPKWYKERNMTPNPEILRSNCDSKMKENLNLMYVGMSRARYKLIGA